MDNIDDGGPAFPHVVSDDRGVLLVDKPGMSLRDWFAGRCMPAAAREACSFEEAAEIAYRAADALIAAGKAARK